jgi:protein-tyrosine phosphatase
MRVLIVCQGNTCRSPMAQGVLRQALDARGLGDAMAVGSAGVDARRPGETADPRAVAAAAARGIDIRDHRVRQLTGEDVASHDVIIAVDAATLRAIQVLDAVPATACVRLLMSFASGSEGVDIPDPYDAGTAQAYSRALDMIVSACDGLADWLAERVSARGARPTC